MSPLRISPEGLISWVGGDGVWTVLEFHQALQGLGVPSPSVRITDHLIQLLEPYRLDASMLAHLFEGAVCCSSGAIYSSRVEFL